MESIATLSTGTKLLLASATLLFLDLFMTWQNLTQQFGKFRFTASLDGWDRPGLLMGLLALGLISLVVVRLTELELSPDVPWNVFTFALSAVLLAVAVLKNVTDAHSTSAAYAGVVFAALTVVGAYLDRDRPAPEPKPINGGSWKPRVRAGSEPTPANGRPHAAQEPESAPAQSTARW